MQQWVGVVASLLGVIVGGLLQHLTARRGLNLQHDWERARIIHSKLEEIAQLAEEMERKFASFYSHAIVAVESGERYQPDQGLIPFARLGMLINFYAPELRPHLEQLLAIREKMGKPISTVLLGRSPTAKSEKQDLNAQFLRAAHEVTMLCEELAKGASSLARKQLKLS